MINRRLVIASLALALALGGLGITRLLSTRAAAADGRVVVLCIDAMDYALTREFIKAGKLPHFARLAESGSFIPQQTSMPPLSPVAWTNFITGMDSGGHGVFDFLRRDPARVGPGFLPTDGVAEFGPSGGAGVALPFTSYRIPRTNNLTLVRRAPAFWNLLDDVDTAIYKLPANYPVEPSRVRTLSGMGTPDIYGSYGRYTYITTDPNNWRLGDDDVMRVRIEHGQLVPFECDASGGAGLVLRAPYNPFRREDHAGENEEHGLPLAVHCDPQSRSVAIELPGRMVVLNEGQWSEWVAVSFPQLPLLHKASGQVRFYLQEMNEQCKLFVSPVQISPGTPGLATADFDLELFEQMGHYYTKGMPEQTKALTRGVLSDEEYIRQSDMVLADHLQALDVLLDDERWQLLCFYVSTIDLDSHVMWRHLDADHPAHPDQACEVLRGHIERRYVEMDAMLGRVRDSLRPTDRLYVLSDHGFAPFRREFNMCRWLQREGYLAYTSRIAMKLSRCYAGVDWAATRAYPIGFAGVCVNLVGREGAGVAESSAKEALVNELRRKLLAVRDYDGTAVFDHVYLPGEIYAHGAALDDAPDLILGYARGYGPADESVEGAWAKSLLSDRLSGFSGHHCCDYPLVPGVCFSSRRLAAKRARMEDMTVTLLKEFGHEPTDKMTGRPLY